MIVIKTQKLYTAIFIILFLIPYANAIEECQRIQNPKELPCNIISTWEYTPPCSTHSADIYLENGSYSTTYFYEDYGNTTLCSFEWNITTQASYNYIVDTGETGNIIVKKPFGVDDRMLSITLTLIGLAVFLFVFGYIIKSEIIRYGSFFLGTIQVILILGINYIEEAGGSIVHLLRIDFYFIAIILMGLAIYSWFSRSIEMINIEDKNEKAVKWEGVSKWK